MRSKLKLSRSLEFISAFFKEQQVINTRGGANLAPPGPDRVKQNYYCSSYIMFVLVQCDGLKWGNPMGVTMRVE